MLEKLLRARHGVGKNKSLSVQDNKLLVKIKGAIRADWNGGQLP